MTPAIEQPAKAENASARAISSRRGTYVG